MSKFDSVTFGRKLRAAREELELTQEELSLRSASVGNLDGQVRISVPYISVLERGAKETRPSEPYLDAIARGLRHPDSYTVREWAGLEREPDWSPLLQAINRDHNLTAPDKDLMRRVFLRLVGQV